MRIIFIHRVIIHLFMISIWSDTYTQPLSSALIYIHSQYLHIIMKVLAFDNRMKINN